MLPRIFEMFTQVDRSLEKSQGGLGIGLCLVQRLVELHGGTVEARSEGHGKGSQFLVRLPVDLSMMQDRRPPAEEYQTGNPSDQRRILVADDNKDAASMLAMMLKIMGNQVFTAHDGLQAVEMAESFRPDGRIREHAWGEKTVLIALTGWGQDEDKRRSQEAGFNQHLVKPVDPAALKKLLAELQPHRDCQVTS
jgi:CheY-like chemotaxis protein